MTCKYCNINYLNTFKLSCHVVRCKKNPNRIINRTFRKNYSDIEIDDLIKKISGFKSLFENKIYDTEIQWKHNLAKYIDTKSLNLFFYKFLSPKCKICENDINVKSYDYRHKNNYCKSCVSKHAWNKNLNYKLISKKIQKTKIAWLKTDAAKIFYKNLGRMNSKKLKKHFQTLAGKLQILNTAKKQSVIMKNKIQDGSWTPNINNYWTHWDAKIKLNDKIYKFRSSWEACFFVSNKNISYEKLRIRYNDKIYIADFYDEKNKILYEIKPKNRFVIEKNKMDAIIAHCKYNNIKFIWINENNILKYINKHDFDNYNLLQYDKMLKGIQYEKNKN